MPEPTAIASTSARRRCVSRCASAPEIGVGVPGAAAIRPSRLTAALNRHERPPLRMNVKNAAFCRAACRRATSASTSTPCARRYAKPPPATSGFGSVAAATTRLMPAATIRSAQGPVRPGVAARLERAVQHCAAGTLAGRIERVHLRMRRAGPAMVPVANDGSIHRGDDGADHGIGAGAAAAAFGEPKRPLQEGPVAGVYHD